MTITMRKLDYSPGGPHIPPTLKNPQNPKFCFELHLLLILIPFFPHEFPTLTSLVTMTTFIVSL